MIPIYAERIREIRQKLEMTQPEFALEIGTTKNQLSKYELNKNEIPAHLILTICEKFKVSANWLLGLEGEEEARTRQLYANARNEIYRATKAIKSGNMTEEQKAALLQQLQNLIDSLN